MENLAIKNTCVGIPFFFFSFIQPTDTFTAMAYERLNATWYLLWVPVNMRDHHINSSLESKAEPIQ
jgi:hypothetical protein